LSLVDHKFRAEDDVERAILDEHQMQYLYSDGDAFHFMNTESFEQLTSIAKCSETPSTIFCPIR
jgi:elongation factor P